MGQKTKYLPKALYNNNNNNNNDNILTNINNSIGVTTIPIKLPAAELKIAAAYDIIMTQYKTVINTSLPPTALVKITADDTGGGMHPTTCNLMGVVSGCG